MKLAAHPCTSPSSVPGSTVDKPPLLGLPGPLGPSRTVGSTTPARFVVRGLLAALDSYLADGLAPHRFTWELSARIEQLAELDVAPRTVTRLRWLARAVTLHPGADQQSTGAESGALAATLLELRTVLAACQGDRSRTG